MLLGISSAYIFFKPERIQLQAATWFGQQARPLPEFNLTDHNGQPFNLASMQGRWHLLFFGFTNCPDICPDTLQKMGDVLRQIEDEKQRERLRMTFVSVDPDRDDLERMKAYVTYFHPELNSARGELDAVNVLTGALGVLHVTCYWIK